MNKLLAYAGLAAKAGKCTFGMEAFLAKKHKLYLVLLADDAQKNTSKKVRDACEYLKIPLLLQAAEPLAKSVGRPGIKVVGILDKRLSECIIEQAKQI